MNLTGFAPAKVNLFLHVGPRQPDGYHPVASLAVFANAGDRLSVAPAEALGLTVTGPFARALESERDNLVLRAVRRLAAEVGAEPPALHITLEKNLPVASGVGGGSADAAAALRLARQALGLDVDDAVLARVGAELGADVPLCVRAAAAVAGGRGDDLAAAPSLPEIHAVLANPGAPVSTAAVYAAFDRRGGEQTAASPAAPDGFGTVLELAGWLTGTRNDLQAPAVDLAPEIGQTLAALARLEGALFVRMSGSGATCFALFETADQARAGAAALHRQQPDWWVKPVRMG